MKFFESLIKTLSRALAGFLLVYLSLSPAWGIEPSRVGSFLKEHSPYLSGRVILQKENNLYASVETNLTVADVRVFRRAVDQRDDSRRLVKKIIGRGKVTVTDSDTAILSVPESIKNQVSVGDELELQTFTLSVHNRSSLDTGLILKHVRSNSGIDTVVVGPPDLQRNGYLLTVTNNGLKMQTLPDKNLIASKNFKTSMGSISSGKADGI
ncbi:MAG: hypothetical protein ABEK50_08590, partial [bacterium]